MKKSQLRLLAAELASGRIPAGEYRARRRELIDDIVAGEKAIERVEPQPHRAETAKPTRLNPPFDPTAAPTTARTAAAASGRFSLPFSVPLPVPIPVILTAGSVLCVAILTAILWPAPPPQVATHTTPIVPAIPPSKEVPASRALVESFVARHDFSAAAIAEFQNDWQQIESWEREQARDELWFGSLVRTLGDEVKTQQALAGLAGGEAALARAQAALAFGEFLGVADKLSSVDNVVLHSAANAGNTTTDSGTQDKPAATVDEPRTSAPQSAAETVTGSTPTGRQWLAAQSDEQLTLQIFAVNHLDRVEQLITAHPDLLVYVLVTEGATPRYRIFHGVFADKGQARQAYEALPAEVTNASQGAIVKSFSVVREDLSAKISAPTMVNDVSDAFTLQVFASASREGAQALVQSFPALKLRVYEVSGGVAPYRVVFGKFSSATEANTAAAALPETLLARVGMPLTKNLASLGAKSKP